MTLPYIFDNQSGIVSAMEIDTNFNAVGAMGVTSCTASGTNAISLTPLTNQPAVTVYKNYQLFGFVAAATTNGTVTLQVNGLGFLPLYDADGSADGPNSLLINQYYIVAYNSALNTGSGGFQLVSPSELLSNKILSCEGAATATNSNTLTNVSGMSLNLIAGASYTFQLYGYGTSNASYGFQIGTAGTATFTNYRAFGFIDSSGYNGGFNTGSPGQIMELTSTTGWNFTIDGFVTVNAAGTFTVQFAQNSGGSSVSTLSQAWLTMIKQ